MLDFLKQGPLRCTDRMADLGNSGRVLQDPIGADEKLC